MRFCLNSIPTMLIRALFWAFATPVHAASSNVAPSNGLLNSSSLGSNISLRILPLGNSMTYGFRSTDGNGYRQHLLDKIGGPAQYIGSVRSGNMTDNHNEGHPGAIITEIARFSVASLALRPNLILLLAGTNDMNLNLTAGAAGRLGLLVDACAAACPEAVILVAQLPPASDAAVEARIEQFNPTVVSLAASREATGSKVLAVDMPRFVQAVDLVDGLHPTDLGYAKMADAWFEGIQLASARGWFAQPVDGNGTRRDGGGARVEGNSILGPSWTTASASTPDISFTTPTPALSMLPGFERTTNTSLPASSSLLTSSFGASAVSSAFHPNAVPTTSAVPSASPAPTNGVSLPSVWDHPHAISLSALATLWISLSGL